MIKISYDELTKSAEDFLEFISRNSQTNKQRLNNNWIEEAVQLVRGLTRTLGNNEEKKKYLAVYNKKAECLLSSVYLHELNFIYKKIIKPFGNDEKYRKYLIPKVKKILNAPLLASQEDSNTNEGRNYMFESLFLAELLAHNFEANFGQINGNPDIEVKANSHIYAIECKRIFSENSFLSNFNNAKDQLNKSLENKKYNFGVPVIDVSRVFIVRENENFLLESSSEQEATKRALNELEKFFSKYKPQLYREYNPKIPALILNLSTPVVLKNQPFIAWGHYLTFCELSNLSQISLFHMIKSDFTKLANNN